MAGARSGISTGGRPKKEAVIQNKLGGSEFNLLGEMEPEPSDGGAGGEGAILREWWKALQK